MTTLVGIVGTWVNRLGIFLKTAECVLKNIFYIDEEIFEAEQHIFSTNCGFCWAHRVAGRQDVDCPKDNKQGNSSSF